MKTKEAILKSLEELDKLTNHSEIYEYIVKKKYYDFGKSKTPELTVSGNLTSFIQKGDNRVKRVKNSNGSYLYYLSKNEDKINFEESIDEVKPKESTKSYQERDLHILLSSYLKNKKIYPKTIFHEPSKNKKDSHQKWIHPDMVGIKFLNLKNRSSNNLMKSLNKSDAFEIISYEIKKDIKSDYDLKKKYFQAVSNSSWANYGYLVALEINSNLIEEIERLNQSFGIGVIELKSNPFESEILFPAKNKELNFKTIDKLCEINSEFEEFITQTDILLKASDNYLEPTIKQFENFCDKYFINDSDIEKYCEEKNIPFENVEENVE